MSDLAERIRPQLIERDGAPSLRHNLACIQRLLDLPGLTELCINRPGEVLTESDLGWTSHDVPALTFAHLRLLVQQIATFNDQTCNEKSPLLSGDLPGGERIQIAIPPAVEPGLISITIRKPPAAPMTPADYDARGFFDDVPDYPVRYSAEQLALMRPLDRQLLMLRASRQYWPFFRLAVAERKTILVSGATNSGKTTFANCLTRFIPADERLITIEDSREAHYPNQRNRVHLLYSEGGQGVANTDGKTLLRATLRMRPDRVLLPEVRSNAYDYIVNIFAGHPGPITGIHADNSTDALEMVALRVRESDDGKGLTREDTLALLRSKIAIIVQLHQERRVGADGVTRKVRRVTEIAFTPHVDRSALAA